MYILAICASLDLDLGSSEQIEVWKSMRHLTCRAIRRELSGVHNLPDLSQHLKATLEALLSACSTRLQAPSTPYELTAACFPPESASQTRTVPSKEVVRYLAGLSIIKKRQGAAYRQVRRQRY